MDGLIYRLGILPHEHIFSESAEGTKYIDRPWKEIEEEVYEDAEILVRKGATARVYSNPGEGIMEHTRSLKIPPLTISGKSTVSIIGITTSIKTDHFNCLAGKEERIVYIDKDTPRIVYTVDINDMEGYTKDLDV
jgi:hypothetical protein